MSKNDPTHLVSITYVHSVDYVGTFDGRPVSGSISVDTLPNSPTEGARLVYHELTGRDLERRRKSWRVSTFTASGETGHDLTLWGKDGLALIHEGTVRFFLRRTRTTSDSDFRAFLDDVAASYDLTIEPGPGFDYRVTMTRRDLRRFALTCADLDAAHSALVAFSRLSPDARHELSETWEAVEAATPFVPPTFGEGVHLEACEIVTGEMSYCNRPFRVVVWRAVGCPLLAWSTDPEAVDALGSCTPRGAVANRAVYYVDSEGSVAVERHPVGGLPLYLDDVSPVLASPLFAPYDLPKGRGDYPVTFEPRSSLARAWRAYRAHPVVGHAVSRDEETVRRYIAARREGRSATSAVKEVARLRDQPSIPYPPCDPRNPLVGAAFAHCDPRPNCRWIEDPAALGFREIDIPKRDRTGWYTSDDCDETISGVLFMLPHGRVVTGYRSSEESNAAVVDVSSTWNDSDSAEHAAALNWADRLASRAADNAREEREAWNAGQQVASLEDENATDLREIKRLARMSYRVGKELRGVGHGLTADRVADQLRVDMERHACEIGKRRVEISRLEDEWAGNDQFDEARKCL